MDTIQDVVSAEPKTGARPDTAQVDDAIIEAGLNDEISELWCNHVKLAGTRKLTSKELRLVRNRLAQLLYEMKALLARPGRGGEWRGWLRERGIPRSTADGLVARHAESLSADGGNGTSQAILESPKHIAEKLASSVWASVKKTLVTGESVVQFIGCFVTAAGVAYEWRSEGLVIFNPVPKAVDGVSGIDVSAEATCPGPQATEGEWIPAADLGPRLPDDVPATAYESPASAPAIDSALQPSGGVPAGIEEPVAEVGAAPLAADQVAAVADGGSGCVV
jgi:hypothetical protein